MSRTSFVKYVWLAHFSRPSAERQLYRAIRRHRVRSIVELGVGDARRALRMIQAACRQFPACDISYAGIDLFESRGSDVAGLSLKDAHRLLTETGARIKLIPGDPLGGLARSANSLTGTDLVVLGADQDAESLRQAWFFVPRLLHEKSLVLIEDCPDDEEDEPEYESIRGEEIARLATAAAVSRAA